MNAEDMYQETILEHYRQPQNKGCIKNADAHARDVNTSCGDVIEIFLNIDSGRVVEIKFLGKGCAISQAAVSMLTESVKNKKVSEIIEMDKHDVLTLLGIKVSAMRLKCALLGLKVLKLALCKYLSNQESPEESSKACQ